MNEYNKTSGIYHTVPIPPKCASLADKVDMITARIHSYAKTEQLLRNINHGYPRYHRLPWNSKLRDLLVRGYRKNFSIPELALAFRRSEQAILKQLESQGYNPGVVSRNHDVIEVPTKDSCLASYQQAVNVSNAPPPFSFAEKVGGWE